MEVLLLPKQQDFIQNIVSREKVFSSGYGAGKTTVLCWNLYWRASHPGAREGLCRKYLVNLRSSTLKTLLEGDGPNPPVMPLGTYEHDSSKKTIRIKDGGEIVYFGIDEPEKIGSMNLSGCEVDEAAELDLADYLMIDGRCRLNIKGIENQVYSATNPRHPSHWMAKRFGFDGSTKESQCHGYICSALENFYLPDSYLQSLKRRTGVDYERNVLGHWVGAEGLVFPNFDPAIHIKQPSELSGRILCGVDDGFTAPMVALRCHVDSDRRIHVAAEFYKAGIADKSDRAQRAIDIAPDAERFIYDTASPDLAAALRDKGRSTVAADKKRTMGIDALRSRFTVQADGKPRITIDPSCTNLIKELLSLEYKPGSEDIKEGPDHALDALRYVVMYLESNNRSAIYTGETKDFNNKQAKEETISQTFERLREDPDFGWN